MTYKRQIDRLPIVPADAKEHNVTCRQRGPCADRAPTGRGPRGDAQDRTEAREAGTSQEVKDLTAFLKQFGADGKKGALSYPRTGVAISRSGSASVAMKHATSIKPDPSRQAYSPPAW